jgi:hypothetical protein
VGDHPAALQALFSDSEEVEVQRRHSWGFLSRGKPNTRATNRKVDPCFGRNRSPVVYRVPRVRSRFRFARLAIRNQAISGVAIGQCRLNVGLWFAFRRFCEIDTCPTPLAAARYFAAGDTSVGFTPCWRSFLGRPFGRFDWLDFLGRRRMFLCIRKRIACASRFGSLRRAHLPFRAIEIDRENSQITIPENQ